MYLSFLCASIIASIFLALIRALQKTRAREQENNREDREETPLPPRNPCARDERAPIVRNTQVTYNEQFVRYWRSVIYKQTDELAPDVVATLAAEELSRDDEIAPNSPPATSSKTTHRYRPLATIDSQLSAATQNMMDEFMRDVHPTSVIDETPSDVQSVCEYYYKQVSEQFLCRIIVQNPLTYIELRSLIRYSMHCETEPEHVGSEETIINLRVYHTIITRIYNQQLIVTNNSASANGANIKLHTWVPIAQIAHHIICVPYGAQSMIDASSCGMRSKCTFLILTATNASDPNCARFDASVIKPMFTSNFADEIKRLYLIHELTECHIARDIEVTQIQFDE